MLPPSPSSFVLALLMVGKKWRGGQAQEIGSAGITTRWANSLSIRCSLVLAGLAAVAPWHDVSSFDFEVIVNVHAQLLQLAFAFDNIAVAERY